MNLVDYIRKHIQIETALLDLMEDRFEYHEHPKGYTLIKPGSRTSKLFFVEKGLLRMYYERDGKDITHFFFPEDSFFIPIEPVFYQQASPWGWELLENSVVRSIEYSEAELYMDANKTLEKFGRLLIVETLRKTSEKLFSIQFQSAKERYQLMIENYPDILRRAPLGDIASYLGITQQTLSVIRAQI